MVVAVLCCGQVLMEISEAAVFSFDYMCLVLVASILAGTGLATNNTVSLRCFLGWAVVESSERGW